MENTLKGRTQGGEQMTIGEVWSQQAAMRMVDANANRAAEGLRTIEDYARLVREDEVAAQWMKQLRHGLSKALERLDRRERLEARCAETDAGTEHTTAGELKRTSLSGLVTAAAERVTQALRLLEEATKVLSPETSQEVKRLRYEAYDLLAQTELRLLSNRPSAQQQLYLLIDCSLPIEEFTNYVQGLAEAGVDLFQLRDKRADGAELVRYGRAAVEGLSKCNSNSKLIINDRVDVALACRAVGVHLGQDDMTIEDARRLVGSSVWIGVSTHNLEQAQAAEQAGADYIGCGPTFASHTKDFAQFAGPAFLREVTEHISLPIFAIGGITQNNLTQVREAGCRRIAVSSAIHAADDPMAAATLLRRALASFAK